MRNLVWALFAALVGATPAAAADITGQQLYEMCRRKVDACADYTRHALRSAGFADKVPFSNQDLKAWYGEQKPDQVQWWICPPSYTDSRIALEITKYMRRDRATFDLSGQQAAILVFTRLDPEKRCKGIRRDS